MKEALLELYRVQRKYPSRKVSLTILSKLSSAYSKNPEFLKLKESDIPELVSILRSLTLLRGDSTPAAYSLLNIILSKAKSQEEKVQLLKSIKHLLINGVDREYQIIWYYRLCWAISPEECEEITSNNNFALLNLLKEATPHYNAFGDCDIESADSKSLEAFVIVDMAVYAACKGKDINPKIGNPFY